MRIQRFLVVATAVAVPTAACAVLLKRRLEARVPRVGSGVMPPHLSRRDPRWIDADQGRGAMNWEDGFTAVVPVRALGGDAWDADKAAHRFARAFFDSKLFGLERRVVETARRWGFEPFKSVASSSPKTSDTSTKPEAAAVFRVGDAELDLFRVESVAGDPGKPSWSGPIAFVFASAKKPGSGGLVRGRHLFAVERLANGDLVRLWFVSQLVLDCADELVEDASGGPVVAANAQPLPWMKRASLELHRVYARMLLHSTVKRLAETAPTNRAQAT